MAPAARVPQAAPEVESRLRGPRVGGRLAHPGQAELEDSSGKSRKIRRELKADETSVLIVDGVAAQNLTEFGIGVALFVYSSAELIGGNGFIAAFVCGLVLGNWVRGRCRFVFEFAEAEGQLLILLTFMIFGAALLPEIIGQLRWSVVGYAVLSLTLVRIAPICLFARGFWPPPIDRHVPGLVRRSVPKLGRRF